MDSPRPETHRGAAAALIATCLANPLIVTILVALACTWGVMAAPFDWNLGDLPRDPVPVDAIPDIGENQQIVFTRWPGRSPRDVEDQVSYPLTVSLMGLPGVQTVRSHSFLGYSSIYVVFKDGVDFYWSRSRVLEKLSSLPSDLLPKNVKPTLGPDATALGQVFWYTLEGRDPDGLPAGGWDPHELRAIQDWQVRYALASVPGVAEVASVGGFTREYQVDVDPDAMRAHGVSLDDVFTALRRSNVDVGARTIEINQVEYVIRGLGFIKGIEDLESTVVRVNDNVPILVSHVAQVALGPVMRRGALDRAGAEAVGGVVVVRHGANPLEVISAIKRKVTEIAPGLPRRATSDDTPSQVTVVPFYDRTELIHETLGTLETALTLEIIITVIVVLVMVMHLGSSLMISGLLPLAVLATFIAMKHTGVDANVVALSGIAIAIGTMVDMGIVLCDGILGHARTAPQGESPATLVHQGASEVAGAVITSVSTTVVSFLPVLTLEAAEGKLFQPLALTKTFALTASMIVALTVIPPAALLWLRVFPPEEREQTSRRKAARSTAILSLAGVLTLVLARHWEPLGPAAMAANLGFVSCLVGGVLGLLAAFRRGYETILRWCLRHKLVFACLPAGLVICALAIWPRLDEEFMPPLDEGSFLYMPTTMPHASIGEALDVLQKQDLAISAIPEVKAVVGKIGRVDSALDPAPVSMIETVVTYHPEYALDDQGRLRRQWRPHIRRPDDIWREIEAAARIIGTTSAPKLQPIATRLVMLQSGIRAAMGVQVAGPDQRSIEQATLRIERLLKQVPSVSPATVLADRIIAKPYLEIAIDREAIARFGLHIRDVQDVIEVAIGGRLITTTVEGRERYGVRVRYPRERRSDIESIEGVLVPANDGSQIPLGQLASIRYTPGPQVIKGENGFAIGHVTFGRRTGSAEVATVEACQRHLEASLRNGDLVLPTGVSYRFIGTWESHERSQRRLLVILPVTLLIIFVILHLQFRSVFTSLLIFSGVIVAWSGGFLLLWLYGQAWFGDVSILGTNMRELFDIHPISLSVAVWVGFLALFGIATDDGVVMATRLKQVFERERPASVTDMREATVRAGLRRVDACLMTTATTLLALLPVLSSQGRGSDIMVPMAIPTVGGMTVALLTMLVVPVGWCGLAELRLWWDRRHRQAAS